MFRRFGAPVCAVLIASATSAFAGDPEKGEKTFRKCKSCHQVGEGAKNRSGPVLNDIVGRTAGTLDGYKFSPAMIAAGEGGLAWTEETLNAFLEDPKGNVPKTKMSFRGLKKPEDRADVIAYLATFSHGSETTGNADNAPEIELDPAILALEGDLAYGEYLSSECLTCHKADGADEGIPSITGWPTDSFAIAMHAYKEKVRTHQVMQLMAGKLSNEEIAALAAYFETLK